MADGLLGGGNRIDLQIAETPLYMVALDIATRAGIKQGLVLAPEHERQRASAPMDGSMISVAQAADLIGISRAAVYKAIENAALRARRIGNVTIVDRRSAAEYRERRSAGEEPAPAKGARGTSAKEKTRASA